MGGAVQAPVWVLRDEVLKAFDEYFMGASHHLSPTYYSLHTLPERVGALEVASSHSLRGGSRRGHIYLSRALILPIRWRPSAMAMRARVYLAV